MANSITLNRTMAHIEANLGSWDQTRWVTENACGTAYCFAGWALQLQGVRICTADCDELGGAHVHREDVPGSILGQMPNRLVLLSVPQVARVILDLSPREAWKLFCGSNTLQDLKLQVRRLTQTSREEQPK